jgi:hypothetical protein
MKPPPVCVFTRAASVVARCKLEAQRLREVNAGHFAACHLRDGLIVDGA